jgi:hypothetical protein
VSTVITFDFTPRLTWTLANTIRQILDANGNAVRLELDPQQNAKYFTDGEFDTTQTYSSSPMGAWSVQNGTNASGIDENTTIKSQLYCGLNGGTAWTDYGTLTAPFIYRDISGNFDVYTRVGFGNDVAISTGGLRVSLYCQSTSASGTSVGNGWQERDDGLFTTGVHLGNVNYTSLTGTGGAANLNSPTSQTIQAGGWLYLRIDRTGNVFTCYWSTDGFNWYGANAYTVASFSSDCYVGITVSLDSTVSSLAAGMCDFLRPWPPYDQTGPLASYVMDSGKSGSTWQRSSFQDYLNEYEEFAPYSDIGFGTLTYDSGASDTPGSQTLTGTYRTTSQMQAQSDQTGRYFELSVKFTSPNGYQLPKFCGASINASTSWA